MRLSCPIMTSPMSLQWPSFMGYLCQGTVLVQTPMQPLWPPPTHTHTQLGAPEKWMSLSSPIMTSPMSLQWPSLIEYLCQRTVLAQTPMQPLPVPPTHKKTQLGAPEKRMSLPSPIITSPLTL
jgi:hypothetical protein